MPSASWPRASSTRHPLRHVLGVRVDAAGGIRVVAVERLDRHGPCRRRGACGVGDVRRRAAAAEWRTLLPVIPTFFRMRAADEVLPRLPADRLDHLAGDEVEHVVVGVGAAEARRERNDPSAAARSPCGRRSTPATTADRRRRVRGRCGARADRGPSARASRTDPTAETTAGSVMTGASQAILPSSTSRPSAVAVKTLVFDAMPKSVCASTAPARRACGRRSPSRRRPCRP